MVDKRVKQPVYLVGSRRKNILDKGYARGWPAASLLLLLLGTPPAAQAPNSSPDLFQPVALPPTTTPRQAAPLAQGTFLVANPGMVDGNFAESVVLLLEHSDDGALGLIVNRPTQAKLARLLPDVAWLEGRTEVVFLGGPVGLEQVFILLRSASPPTPAEHVVSDIYATGSEKVLRAIIERADPSEMFRVYAGYAGWAPGQLEGEIERGGWRLAPGDAAIVFEVPSHDVWPELIQRTSGDWVGPVQSPNPGIHHVFTTGRQAASIHGLQ